MPSPVPPDPTRQDASARIPAFARDPRRATAIGFVWGFAEGIAFFIVPDVYVTFATLFARRAGAIAWLASIAGSLAGVAGIHLATTLLGVDYLHFLTAIPAISTAMLADVSRAMAADGLPRTPWLVLGGVPLKVYAGVAFAQGIPLAAVMIWTVFARVVRIAPVYALAAAARTLFRARIDARPAYWTTLLALAWTAFYAFYFVHMAG